MLKALYDYAVVHDLSLPDGYVKKTVSAYIMFSSETPDFVGIWMGDDREIACPDIGSLANGKEKSNIIVEKRSVVIPDEANAKSDFFRNALVQFGEVDSDASLCAAKISDADTLQRIRALLNENKIKPANRISFMVDDRKLHDSPHLLHWWTAWRQETLPSKKGDLSPCLITGELTTPIATAPSIKGLRVVGGHASGDSLICFDKPAFCSYGQKQAANAPVSETAMGAVKSALDHLLTDAPILCGMKIVHWFDRDVPPKDDPLFDDNFFGFETEENPESEVENIGESELQARLAADRMIGTVRTGETPLPLDAAYHILLLTGVGGRVMVRRYERGRFDELQQNLEKWNRDLALVNPYGSDPCKPMKLTGRLIRLLKYQKNDRRIFERLGKELSGITPAILTAILTGGRLPDAVAVRALAYIRSKMLASEEGQNGSDDTLDGWAFQWLKVWLLRNTERSEEHLMEIYNPNHPEPAYHCGAAMAVYASIQTAAMPNANVTVVQRYYASCIQTPALVLGRLSQLSVHHLAKIEYSNIFRKLLEQVNTAIGPEIPTTLDLEKQSYFALGYYQMSAKMRHDRTESAKNKNAQEET